MTTMEWLYIATGGTGGLTLAFIVYWFRLLFVDRRAAVAFFSLEQARQQLEQAILRARREVLVQVQTLDAPSIATALRKAKANGVELKLLFARHNLQHLPSLVHVFQKEGLEPRVEDETPLPPGNVIVLDDEVILCSLPLLDGSGEDVTGELLLLRGHDATRAAFRQRFLACYDKSQKLSPPTERTTVSLPPTAGTTTQAA
jgi:hypothetical protein